MTTIRELVTKIGFDVDDRKLRDVDNALNEIKSTMVAIGTAAVAAAGSLFALTSSAARAGDEAIKTARRIGFNVEELQALQFAAERSGVSTENLNTSLAAFSRRVGDAANDSGPAARALDELGVSVNDANGNLRDNDELLAEISDKFAEIESPARRAALAQDLFSRQGRELIDVLALGSDGLAELANEAQELGFIISEEAAKDAEEFNDSMLNLRRSIDGIRNALAFQLMPAFTETIDTITEWIKVNRELILQRLDSFIEGLVSFLRILFNITRSVTNAFISLSQIVGGVENVFRIMLATWIALRALRLAQAVLTIATALRAMGIAALFANGALVAKQLVIAAIIAGLFFLIRAVVNWVRENEVAVSIIRNLWNGFLTLFSTIFSTIISIIDGFNRFVISVFTSILNVITNIVESITGAVAGFFNFFRDRIEEGATLWTIIWDSASAVISLISDAFGSLFSNTASLVSDFISGFMAGLSQITSFINDTLFGSLSQAVGFVSEIADGVASVASNVASSIGGAISGTFSTIRGFITGAEDEAEDLEIPEQILTIDKQDIQEVAKLSKQFVIESQEGLNKISGQWKKLYEKITLIFTTSQAIFEDFKSNVIKGFNEVGDEIVNNINRILESYLNAISEISNKINNELGNAGLALQTASNGNLGSLLNGGNEVDSQIVRENSVNNNSRSVNVNSEVVVNAPPGTESQQEQFLRNAARESFRQEYQKELENVLFQNPDLE